MTLPRKPSPSERPLCHRLFFALTPPPQIAARIGLVRDALGPSQGLVRDDRLHMTMLILDDLPFAPPPAMLEAIIAAASSISLAPIPMLFDTVVSNGGISCLVPSEGKEALKALKAALTVALGRIDLPPRHGWRFSPHVTLLYQPRAPRNVKIAPIGWEAREFVLIHSLFGKTQHMPIDRWPLIEQLRLL